MTTVRRSRQRRGVWTRIFGWGLLLWTLSVVVTYATANVLLVSTLVLLRSFLVPVTFVVDLPTPRQAERRCTDPGAQRCSSRSTCQGHARTPRGGR